MWFRLRNHTVKLSANLGIGGARLFGRDIVGQLLLHLLQEAGVLRQHGVAVPLVQRVERLAHLILLGDSRSSELVRALPGATPRVMAVACDSAGLPTGW